MIKKIAFFDDNLYAYLNYSGIAVSIVGDPYTLTTCDSDNVYIQEIEVLDSDASKCSKLINEYAKHQIAKEHFDFETRQWVSAVNN